MKRLLVNDALNQLGEHTFWNDLQEWFGMEFVGGDYATLAMVAAAQASIVDDPGAVSTSLIVRNATWFPLIKTACPQIALLQDIIPKGPLREMQEAVLATSRKNVFNSVFTAMHYEAQNARVIPLPIDFSLFEPGNPMGLQQELGLPDGCVCWVGASQGEAATVKGWDIFRQIVRANPDIPFVAVFKDAVPNYVPPNLRCYAKLPQVELVKVIGACAVGLCTSRIESQHLAGIEMGACGLPLVVPPVGCYWKREDLPGVLVNDPTAQNFATAIREVLPKGGSQPLIRDYWRKEFDKPVVRAAWTKLVEEVECSGAY
jgi:hypothetical protein